MRYDVTIQYTVPVEAETEQDAVDKALYEQDEIYLDEGNVIEVRAYDPNVVEITKVKDTSFPYVRAWGMFLGSSPWYIEEQVAQAQHQKAPALAIYRNQDGTWTTAESLSPAIRERVDKYLGKPVAG